MYKRYILIILIFLICLAFNAYVSHFLKTSHPIVGGTPAQIIESAHQNAEHVILLAYICITLNMIASLIIITLLAPVRQVIRQKLFGR